MSLQTAAHLPCVKRKEKSVIVGGTCNLVLVKYSYIREISEQEREGKEEKRKKGEKEKRKKGNKEKEKIDSSDP